MLGRVVGAPVVVSRGSLITAAVLTLVLVPTVGSWVPGSAAPAVLVALAVVALLYGSTFLHEVAHAAVGRRHGLVPHEIAFTLLGGHTSYGSAAARPGASAAVAAAGPAVNLAIAAVAGAGTLAVPAGSVPAFVLLATALTNGALGVFNLLPGLPLDGGHVLEALVWRLTGRRRTGTLAAAWGGRLVAVGVLAFGLLPPLLTGRAPAPLTLVWTLMVGGFIWLGAGQAATAARRAERVGEIAVRGLMRPALAVPVAGTLADLERVLGAGPGAAPDVVLLAPDGRPAAYLDAAAALSVPAGARGATPLTAVAVPLPVGAVVDAGLTGSAAVSAIGAVARSTPVMAVTESADDGGAPATHGRVVGLLRAQDVISALRGGT